MTQSFLVNHNYIVYQFTVMPETNDSYEQVLITEGVKAVIGRFPKQMTLMHWLLWVNHYHTMYQFSPIYETNDSYELDLFIKKF